MANNIKIGDVDIQIPSFEFKKFGGLIGVILVAFSTNSVKWTWIVSPRVGTKFLKTKASISPRHCPNTGKRENAEKTTASKGTKERSVTYDRYPA